MSFNKHNRLVTALSIVALTAAACDRAESPTEAVTVSPQFAVNLGHFKSFRVPTDNSRPRHITLGSDGNMWFTESDFDVSKIARITPDGAITEFTVPSAFSQPSDITLGADGAVYFTLPSGSPTAYIGRATTDGQITEFAPPCNEFGCSITPSGIASGPDGNIWFTEGNQNAIGKLEPATGTVTLYPIPTPIAGPVGITAGPDGALWFTESFANQLGRITTAGVITEFPGANGASRITTGPDGNLWYVAPFNNLVGRMTTAGVVTEFAIGSPSQPRDIVTGPDGNLWFTEFNAERLSRITPDGVITQVQKVRGGPWGIARGAGNTIWLTQIDDNRVGRFTIGK